MRKLLILLLCVPLIGFGQHEKEKELIIFLNNYQCGCCFDEDKIDKLDSSNVISWVQDSMWYYDNIATEKCVEAHRPNVTHYTDWGDIRCKYLNILLQKYFQIVKILANDKEFNLIEENQRNWEEYSLGWTKEGYKLIINSNGWFPKTARIQESLIEIYELRIKQLKILIHFELADNH